MKKSELRNIIREEIKLLEAKKTRKQKEDALVQYANSQDDGTIVPNTYYRKWSDEDIDQMYKQIFENILKEG